MTDTPDPENVVPPNELERRRRVMQCTEDLGDLLKDIYDRAKELSELGVPVADWVDLVARNHLPPQAQALVSRLGPIAGPFLDGMLSARRGGASTPTEGVMFGLADYFARGLKPPAIDPSMMPEPEPYTTEELASENNLSMNGLRTRRVIQRLFADAPKMTDASGKVVDESQAPALMCHVMLKAGGSIQGTLSVTPEGTLRCAMPNTLNGKPVIVEHFFDYEEVADIAVFREVNTTMGPRIITS